MNRHEFINGKGNEPQPDPVKKGDSVFAQKMKAKENALTVGMVMTHTINGSQIVLLAPHGDNAWMVQEEAHGHYKTHDLGRSEKMTSYIHQFYKEKK